MVKLLIIVSLLGVGAVVLGSDASINNIDGDVPVKYEKTSPVPLPPISNSYKDNNAEIFVGVSHYRDSRCAVTLTNLFAKAKYPDRIKVGIAQQIHTEKDEFDCIRDYCKSYTQKGQACAHRSQISVIQFTHQDSRGPTYARYQQQSLMQNEEFCMQVDAHSNFVRDWDLTLATMWGATENEYAIISTAAPDVAVLDDRNLNGEDQKVPHLCQATFDSRGNVVNLPPTYATHLSKPILAPLYSSGFAFSKCHAELKVLHDPNLQVTFDVDDFTRYARFWTRGYDVYTPNQIVVTHDYEHALGKNSNSETVDPMRWVSNGMTPEFTRLLYERSMKRVATLLAFPEGDKDVTSLSLLTNYGLGTKRTLDQLIEFTGIDTRNKQVFGDRCKELHWVSFETDPDPYTTTGDLWGQAPEMLLKGGANVPLVKSGSVAVLPASVFTESIASIQDRQRRRAEAVSSGNADSAVAVGGADGRPNLRAEPIKLSLHKGAGGRIEQDIIQAEEKVVAAFQHRGKELWWIFQSVDTAVETLMNHIDQEVGMGHGHRVVKLILLAAPVFIFVLAGAIYVMISGSSKAHDAKRI